MNIQNDVQRPQGLWLVDLGFVVSLTMFVTWLVAG